MNFMVKVTIRELLALLLTTGKDHNNDRTLKASSMNCEVSIAVLSWFLENLSQKQRKVFKV